MNELEALLILNSLPHIGTIKIRRLMEHYGSAVAILQAPLDNIARFPGFGPKIIQAWKKGLDNEQWRENLILAQRLEARIIPFTHADYPQRLLTTDDYPLILYMQGEMRKEDDRCLAIVGTRQTSIYGLEIAKAISQKLAAAGFSIVSGLARGIDTAAHRGALEKGRSIAVLGSGLAHIYPAENRELAIAMTKKGAVISEFPMGAPPDRHHFPKRNRIVSGMSMGTILIEAPIKSGAMLTVERALHQGRPVFALPGRADLESFKGNHSLIKSGKAELIEDGDDVLKYFKMSFVQQNIPLFKGLNYPLEKEEEELLLQFPNQEVSIEELMLRASWPIAKLNGLLMSLVLKKVVKEYPGKIYKKIC